MLVPVNPDSGDLSNETEDAHDAMTRKHGHGGDSRWATGGSGVRNRRLKPSMSCVAELVGLVTGPTG